MSRMGNKISAQEDLDIYEYAGSGTAEKISQDDEDRVNGENVWAPSNMAAMVTVAVGNNPGAASPASMLNHMM